MSRNQKASLAALIESVILTCEEAEYAQDVKLSHSVGLKWSERRHDPGCLGDHPIETSTNGLVQYPCPL